MSAIERSDVVLFVLDGEQGIRAQDKHVVGFAHDARKPIIIVYNKWDTVDKEETLMDDVRKQGCRVNSYIFHMHQLRSYRL
ncbi:GTP-binding protein [Erysipelothrix sp. D19-032]